MREREQVREGDEEGAREIASEEWRGREREIERGGERASEGRRGRDKDRAGKREKGS